MILQKKKDIEIHTIVTPQLSSSYNRLVMDLRGNGCNRDRGTLILLDLGKDDL